MFIEDEDNDLGRMEEYLWEQDMKQILFCHQKRYP